MGSRASKVTIANLRVLQLMRDLSYDPIKELIEMVQDKTNVLADSLRAKIHTELACYTAPKIRAVDIGQIDAAEGMEVHIQSFAKPEPQAVTSTGKPLSSMDVN